MADLKNQSLSQLLVLHVLISEELRKRGVVRSGNAPTGDLAEYLFCQAFGWTQAPKSQKGFDATSKDGIRYEIKGRRLSNRDRYPSREVSAIRDLEAFDFLAAVLFDYYYQVERAALIPAAVVKDRSTYVAHDNKYKFMLRDDVWDIPGVQDVTKEIWEMLSDLDT